MAATGTVTGSPNTVDSGCFGSTTEWSTRACGSAEDSGGAGGGAGCGIGGGVGILGGFGTDGADGGEVGCGVGSALGAAATGSVGMGAAGSVGVGAAGSVGAGVGAGGAGSGSEESGVASVVDGVASASVLNFKNFPQLVQKDSPGSFSWPQRLHVTIGRPSCRGACSLLLPESAARRRDLELMMEMRGLGAGDDRVQTLHVDRARIIDSQSDPHCRIVASRQLAIR